MTARYQLLAAGGVYDFTVNKAVAPDRSSAAWQEYQEWLTQGGSPLPPDSLGTDDLATTKSKRCDEIDAYAAGLRNKAVRGRSSAEMATWTAKLVEARAYTVTPVPTAAPLLNSIATVRGCTLADLVAKVLAQAVPFLQAEAYIDGVRGKHCDAVDAMTTVQEVVVYDWHADWPVIP